MSQPLVAHVTKNLPYLTRFVVVIYPQFGLVFELFEADCALPILADEHLFDLLDADPIFQFPSAGGVFLFVF